MKEQEKEFVQISLERYEKLSNQDKVKELQERCEALFSTAEKIQHNFMKLLEATGNDYSSNPIHPELPIEIKVTQSRINGGNIVYVKQSN